VNFPVVDKIEKSNGGNKNYKIALLLYKGPFLIMGVLYLVSKHD
tara:strand:- start:712 stop:843 length:132 start_codon:yes stop_codon:yes gene_type:complete